MARQALIEALDQLIELGEELNRQLDVIGEILEANAK